MSSDNQLASPSSSTTSPPSQYGNLSAVERSADPPPKPIFSTDEAEDAITLSGSGVSSSNKAADDSAALPVIVNAVDAERAKLEAKIEDIRDRLIRHSIAREHDVEEFLKITSHQPVNPQIARIKSHFEKQNKKHTQEAEKLQKKLDDYERRLSELDNSENGANLSVNSSSAFNRSSSGRFLHSVGHGIKRTGANLVQAPLGIAQRVLRNNVFGGSTEALPQRVDSVSPTDGTRSVGKSTFYDPNAQQPATAIQREPSGSGQRELRPAKNQLGISSPPKPVVDVEFNNGDGSPSKEDAGAPAPEGSGYRALRQRYAALQHEMDTFKKETEAELRSQENEIVNSRFRIQHLEQTINETTELHQNEIRQLKNELNMIGIRMDYQYNDRFKKIEESIEQTENRVVRMETSWRESQAALERRRSPWNSLMFSGANIVVELLKIALYLMAVALDSTKACLNSLGFSGTRKRAGVVLVAGLVLFLFWGHLERLMLSIFS